ncbi:ATP-binding cassette domain-containing protein [Wenzhouxiangella limi]|uniref:Probable ATP-binding protein YheS n=1 Tax=Wenzhouxiangella limi TaxID=2707351 RepID=A0A845V940_9GAMM|nr:ATP-binding cassette domain-containing protein [Wenzhouxiangella limi]NDY96445.1 ATP-binding cassette domain-containing protein [Wenzhouxiangella limi]
MIQLSDITLRHGPEALLESTSATLYPGHKVGLIGANGSGKTSLFRLLLGEIDLDAGELSLPSDWRLAHMAQEIDDLDRPAIDYVTDGDDRLRAAERRVATAEADSDGHAIAEAHAELGEAGGYDAHARAGALLNGLGFATAEHQKPVSDFSGGWRIRLSLARALMCPSDLLLLDEPTNHLDMETVVWLEDWLRRYEGTLLLISHDRDFLDQVVDSVLHIEHRRLNAYSGGYSSFERQRAERLAGEQAAREKQQREIAHIQKFIDRFRAKATKARAAQSRIKALERMEVLAPAHVDSPFDFAFPTPPPATNPVLHLDQVDLGYGETRVLEQVSLSLSPGDRIGLLGLNGAGKSTLVRALAGDLEPLSGRITASPKLQVGYFAQHQLEQLDPEASPVTHLARLTPEVPEQRLRNFLGGFDFRGDMATGPVAHFSGGEKARLVLAMLVWQAPNLLLLDEPSNHLDLDMRHALTVALQGFDGAVITVSHDRHLLGNTVEDFWLIDHGTVERFDGDLDDYRRWLRDRPAETGPESGDDKAIKPKSRPPSKATRATLKPLRNRVDRLAQAVDQAAERLHALERALADPELYAETGAPRLKALLSERATLQQKQSDLEAEWLQAETELEQARDPQGA